MVSFTISIPISRLTSTPCWSPRRRGEFKFYLLCGALVGAVGAVRLNGLLVGLILLAIHLVRPATNESTAIIPRTMARLSDARLWLSGLAAVLTLVAIQP